MKVGEPAVKVGEGMRAVDRAVMTVVVWVAGRGVASAVSGECLNWGVKSGIRREMRGGRAETRDMRRGNRDARTGRRQASGGVRDPAGKVRGMKNGGRSLRVAAVAGAGSVEPALREAGRLTWRIRNIGRLRMRRRLKFPRIIRLRSLD